MWLNGTKLKKEKERTEENEHPSVSTYLQVHRILKGLQVNLGAVVRPGTELHLAGLLVKREEGDVNGAGGLVDGWGHPADTPGVKQMGLGHVGDSKLSICTGKRRREVKV